MGLETSHTRLIWLMTAMLVMLLSGMDRPALGQSYSYGDSDSRNAPCLGCHGSRDKINGRYYINTTDFGHTTHSKFGCTTCHNAITASHPDGSKVPRTTSCGDCHNDVASQYAASSHAGNASCSGCHNPHSVYSPWEVSGEQLNKQCAACHTSNHILATHAKWLPQTETHLGAIACVTCHSKAEDYIITIYIGTNDQKGRKPASRIATYDELSRKADGSALHYLVDRNHDNYISLDELRRFNNNPSNKGLHLKAMLTPVKPTHSFQTFDNRWDCTFCHASGPEIMQTSNLAFPEKDGTFRQIAIEKGAVLDTLQAVPDFYLMGSSRDGMLNKIGLAIIAGGLIMPVGHGFLRFLSRKNRS